MKESNLLKALSDMEDIAKGHTVTPGASGKGNQTPKTTSSANGGLSGEGDVGHVSVSARKSEAELDDDYEFDAFEDEEGDDDGDVAKGKGKKKKTLSQWAKEEEGEEAHKGGDSEEGDDEDDESMDDEEETYKGKKGKKSMKKSEQSISDLMKSDASSGAVLDVAPFLETLVDQISDSMDSLRKSLDQVNRRLNSQQKVLKAVGAVTLRNEDLTKSLVDSPTSQGPKSMLSKSEVHERFEGDDHERPDFTKSQVLDAMVDLAQAGKVTPIAVSRYETTNTMEEDVRKSVENHLMKSA